MHPWPFIDLIKGGERLAGAKTWGWSVSGTATAAAAWANSWRLRSQPHAPPHLSSLYRAIEKWVLNQKFLILILFITVGQLDKVSLLPRLSIGNQYLIRSFWWRFKILTFHYFTVKISPHSWLSLSNQFSIGILLFPQVFIEGAVLQAGDCLQVIVPGVTGSIKYASNRRPQVAPYIFFFLHVWNSELHFYWSLE